MFMGRINFVVVKEIVITCCLDVKDGPAGSPPCLLSLGFSVGNFTERIFPEPSARLLNNLTVRDSVKDNKSARGSNA